MTTAITTDIQPAISEVRAPQIMRDKMSRPSSSVPNQYIADGALRTARKLALTGSNGAIHGASSATSTKKPSTMPRPSMATWLRLNLAQARLRARGGVTVAAVASAVPPCVNLAFSG